MKLASEFGPLIEFDEVEGGYYELRGDDPGRGMIYVYIKGPNGWLEDATQKGASPAPVIASNLIAGLKRKAA